MPSLKNPLVVVLPTSGKLPAGTVSASSLTFLPSGGGAAHVANPHDAHMASAIGINPLDPSGNPLLSTVGGTVDGESVTDFILAVRDLFPTPPDTMGVNSTVPNSGIPNWYELNNTGDAISGGFVRGVEVVYTHCLIPPAVTAVSVFGMIYPADRGVLAFYQTPTGDYSAATLLAALCLGSVPAPTGIPPTSNPAFAEYRRSGDQADYVPSMGGLNKIALQERIAVLKDYSAYSVPWAAFGANFARYQVAGFSCSQAIGTGDVGSFLLVHWREGYATSLAAIQPAAFANMTPTNCYSATTPDADTAPMLNINRHNVFVDAVAASPVGVSFTTSVNAGMPLPAKVKLSGVEHYTGVDLRWDLDVAATGLWADSFYTGVTATGSGPPAGFESALDPVSWDLSDFGFPEIGYGFSQLHPGGPNPNYSTTNPPLAGDLSELDKTAVVHGVGTQAAPVGGYGLVRATLRKPFVADTSYADTTKYLFNSCNQSGVTLSTDALEVFCDEAYRCILTTNTAPNTKPILPAGDHFDSTVALVNVAPWDLQVIGHRLVYPSVDYSGYLPAGPDYSLVKSTEFTPVLRQYLRCFDTLTARATGKIRIVGLPFAALQATAGRTGDDGVDQPGGAKIELCAGGTTTWFNLGRNGPGLVPDQSAPPMLGCLKAVTVLGPDEIEVEYNMGAFVTQTNGGGKFPLFIRIEFIHDPVNGNDGTGLYVSEIEWLPTP